MIGRAVSPTAMPRPQESSAHCKEELPGVLPAESLHPGALGLAPPAREPTPACPHLAEGDPEAPAQRSQRADLSTAARPQGSGDTAGGPVWKAGLCWETLAAQLQAPPPRLFRLRQTSCLRCASVSSPDTIAADRGTGAPGERGHGERSTCPFPCWRVLAHPAPQVGGRRRAWRSSRQPAQTGFPWE